MWDCGELAPITRLFLGGGELHTILSESWDWGKKCLVDIFFRMFFGF